MATDGFYPMNPVEIARGMVLDTCPPRLAARPGPNDTVPDPRGALESLLRDELQRAPCFVAFSGGRDSSALLALAVKVARRDGLPEPVALTRRHPELPEADESEWQARVIDHLGDPEWVVTDVRDGSLDLVGPVAGARLRKHGVLWPPLLHADAPFLEVAAGGTIINGEGGDQIFSWLTPRIGPLARHLARRRVPSLRALTRAILTAGPRPAARWYGRRRAKASGVTWLRPHHERALVQELGEELARRPLRWDDSVRRLMNIRPLSAALANRSLVAAAAGIRYCHPFLSRGFLDGVAALGGWRGLGLRSEGMGRIFGDLLPDAVLRRQGKARFNRAVFGAHSVEFARSWDGEGLDPEVVDPERLRRVWLAEHPHGASFASLQAAWLASQHHQ